MKKVLLIIFVFILVGCQKEELLEFRFTDYYEYMIDNEESIVKIEMVNITESGNYCYDVTSYKDTLYNNIINTTILSKSDDYSDNIDLIYKFIFDDESEIEYYYNGKYLNYNNQNYEINNYLKLTDIEDKKIECN